MSPRAAGYVPTGESVVSETTPSRSRAFGRERPAALGFIYAAIMMNTVSMGVIEIGRAHV